MDNESENKWQTMSDKKSDKPDESINGDISDQIDLSIDDEKTDKEIKDENLAGLEEPTVQSLENKVIAVEKQAHENWEKAMRATAELDNVRRRAQRDVENAHKYGVEKMINDLLPVMDSLEQALQTSQQADSEPNKAMQQGIELTIQLFLGVLEKFNVKQIDPIGETFDPNLHEAMSMQEAPDSKPNSVLVVFQKGYVLIDRTIRPARVIVAKGGKPEKAKIDEKV